jgi:hypothetical protein
MRRRLNASIAINVLAQFSMAGFEVTLHGRFWVTAEEKPRLIRRATCCFFSVDSKVESSAGSIPALAFRRFCRFFRFIAGH